MAKISKNAKKLLALTLAGVMTVGTAVPGTAMSSVQEVKAADTYDSATDAVKAVNTSANLEQITAAVNKEFPVITDQDTTASKFEDTIQKAIENIVGPTFDVKVNATTLNTGEWTGTYTLERITDPTDKVENSPLTLKFSYYTDAIVQAKIMDNVSDDITVDVEWGTSDGAIETAAKAKALEAVKQAYYMLSTDEKSAYPNVPAESNISSDSTYTNGIKDGVWHGKFSYGNAEATDITVTINKENSPVVDAVEKIKNELTSVGVSKDLLKSGDCQDEKVMEAVVNAANNLFDSTSGITVTSTTKGTVSTDMVWTGDLTVTFANNNGTDSRKISDFQVKLVEASAETPVASVKLIDGRTNTEFDIKDGKKSIGDVELSKVQVEVTDKKGNITYLTASNGNTTFTGTVDGQNVTMRVDTSECDFTKLGEGTIIYRVDGADEFEVSIPVQKIKNVKFTPGTDDDKLNVALSGGIAKIVSSNTEVARNYKDGDGAFVLVGAGSTELTTTTKNSDTGKTTLVVDEYGNMSFKNNFVTETTTKAYADLDIKASSDAAVTSSNTNVAVASHVVNEAGQDALQITSVHPGTATITIAEGKNGKIKYTVPVEITETGLIKIGTTVVPSIKSVTISSADQDKLQSEVYYKTVETKSDTGAYKTVLDDVKEKVNAEDITVNVTLQDGTKDSLSLSSDAVEASLSGDTGVGNGTITLNVLGSGSSCSIGDVTVGARIVLFNNSATFGFVADEVKSSNTSRATIELAENEDGKEVVVIKSVLAENAMRDVTLTATDGNFTSTAAIKVGNYQIDGQSKPAFTKPSINKGSFTAPTKTEYTIGEELDLTGATFTHEVNGSTVSVKVIDGMITGFDSSKVDSDQTLTFSYGNYTDSTFKVNINPATASYTNTALGLAADEKISSVSVSGDGTITATPDTSKTNVVVTAKAVEKEGIMTVTSSKGNIYKFNIAIGKDGKITTEGIVDFKAEAVSFTKTDLNLTPAELVVSSDAVTANIAGEKVIVTSVKPGSATITVMDKDGNKAIITVTVAENGKITSSVTPYTKTGFVRGSLITEGIYAGQYDYYYYEDGEMVKSDWAEVDENGTKVWYHFDKDGKMQRGWIKDETGWKLYYLDFNGRMYHDTWANAEANEGLNMPKGMYYLQSDGSAQMNGWAKAPGNENAWWYCAAGTGVFINVPENWAATKLW